MKIAAFLSLLLAALPARSQEERKFGDPGVVVPSGSITMGSVNGTSLFDLEPTLQYFYSPNVALGLTVSYFHSSSQDAYALSPSLGYNLRLADVLSVFPQASVSFGYSGTTELGAGLFVPILIHPVQHFFIGFGPDFRTGGPTDDLFRNNVLVVHTVIGGWL